MQGRASQTFFFEREAFNLLIQDECQKMRAVQVFSNYHDVSSESTRRDSMATRAASASLRAASLRAAAAASSSRRFKRAAALAASFSALRAFDSARFAATGTAVRIYVNNTAFKCRISGIRA